MAWWTVYLGIALVAGAIAAALTPLCRALAWKTQFLDKPLHEAHKRHQKSTPLLGGVALWGGWVITVGCGLLVATVFPQFTPDSVHATLSGLGAVFHPLYTIIAGATALVVVGLIDDRKPMGPGVKLACQAVVCALVALDPKLQVSLFWSNGLAKYLLTLGWLLFIINAVNFFDNMDGLASGLAGIAALLFTVVALLNDPTQVFVAALGAATTGTALGFYLHNRSPATIFMGDAGSHFLGFMLGILASLTTFFNSKTALTEMPVLIPLLILAVPIFDTFAVVVIRLRQGKPIYRGDHNHISHRFLRLGMTHRQAVWAVHLLALATGLGALPLLWVPRAGALLILIQAAAMLTLVTLLHTLATEKS